jgi:hypothetical protein
VVTRAWTSSCVVRGATWRQTIRARFVQCEPVGIVHTAVRRTDTPGCHRRVKRAARDGTDVLRDEVANDAARGDTRGKKT